MAQRRLLLFLLFFSLSLLADDTNTTCTYRDWPEKEVKLENDFILSAQTLQWCHDTQNNDGNVKIKAEGNVTIGSDGGKTLLSVRVNTDGTDYNLTKGVVFIDLDESNATKVVFPGFIGLGTSLHAENIRRNEVAEAESMELIRNYPWRFYPAEADEAARLVLYPAFFRPVFSGIFALHGKAFAYMANIGAVLKMDPDDSLHVPVPMQVDATTLTTMEELAPVVGINVGSWFGQDFIIPLETADVRFSQTGDTHAAVSFSIESVVGSTLESVSKSSFWDYAYNLHMSVGGDYTLEKQFMRTKFDDADEYGNSQQFWNLSAEERNTVKDELKAFQDQKHDQAKYNFNLFKQLLTMTVKSGIDYDFLSSAFDLKPVIDLSIFSVKGSGGEIDFDLGFQTLDGKAYFNNIGFDATLPDLVRDLTPEPQYALEKAALKDPFCIGIALQSGSMSIKGLAQPLYDLLESGGTVIPYELMHVKVDVGAGWVLLDELGGFKSIHDIPIIGQWILSGNVMISLKFGQTTGFSASGNASVFKVIAGRSVGMHLYFPGPDFALSGSEDVPLLGVSVVTTFSGKYNKNHSDYPLKASGTATWKVPSWVPIIHGWKLGSVGVDAAIGARTGATYAEATKYIWWPWPVNPKTYYARVWIYDPDHNPHTWFDAGTLKNDDAEKASFTMGTLLKRQSIVLSAENDEEIPYTFDVPAGYVDLSAMLSCSDGSHPRFSVTMPDGTQYTLDNTYAFDRDALLAMAQQPITTADENRSGTGYFIYDENGSTTLFGHAYPPEGNYSITVEAGTDTQICTFSTYVTPKLATLEAAEDAQQTIAVDYRSGGTFGVRLQSSGGMETTPVTLYARPLNVRDHTADVWEEVIFGPDAPASMRAGLTDGGDYDYVADETGTLGEWTGTLQATHHSVSDHVTASGTEPLQQTTVTKAELTAMQRNFASTELGAFELEGDGTHTLGVTLASESLSQGEYRLIARAQNRLDAPYVTLPYTLRVTDQNAPASPVIDSVELSSEGEAQIYWHTDENLSALGKVRLFVYEDASNDASDLYTAHIDFDPAYDTVDPLTLPGLVSGKGYRFAIALLDQNRTMHSHLSRGASLQITQDGLGAPNVKLVDVESYAAFDQNGDLAIRMRVLNTSTAAMKAAPVKLYYRHKSDATLIASFELALEGETYKDIELAIPFKNLDAIALERLDYPEAVVFDIDTSDQDELLAFDNFGLISVENMHYFTAVQSHADTKTANVAVTLQAGWNLVADAVWDEDIFDKIGDLDLYMYNGETIRQYLPNEARGGAYFVRAKHDQSIVVTGMPIVPDFTALEQKPWQLLGTGVDIVKSTAAGPDDGYTYRPGEGCDRIFVLRDNGTYPQWTANPDVIRAGEGFWCQQLGETE